MEVAVLYRQGKSMREIARDTGIARNTVRAVLRGEHDEQYGPREPRPTKLDPHKAYLRDRLKNAGKIRLSATVLLREIRAQGYVGGITQLKDYVNVIRPTEPTEPVVRFETEPGKQLQIDFVDFRRGNNPLRAFTAESSYSRFHRYLRESFFAPIATSQSELVDVPTANCEVRLWLDEIANCRIHAILKERPIDRFGIERLTLRALPLPYAGRRIPVETTPRTIVPIPVESLQHPLAIYEQFAQEISS